MIKNKDIFWKALVLTVIVFFLGVFLGYLLERNRLEEFRSEFRKVELEWADARLQSQFFLKIEQGLCEDAINQNLIFADKIYQEGLKLDKYDASAPLTESSIEFERTRYALFKTEFLLNSIALKEKCNANYTNLIYFFAANPTDEQIAQQNVQSEILKEIKNKYGKDIMLIPLPIDLDISVINIFRNSHDIKTVPTVLINEKVKLAGVQSFERLEQEISNNDKK